MASEATPEEGEKEEEGGGDGGDAVTEPPMPECLVMGPEGPLCSVDLEDGIRLAQIRSAIESKTGLDARTQRLFHGTRELFGSEDLAELLSAAAQGEAVELQLVQRSKQQVRWLAQLKDLPWHDEGDAAQWLAAAPPGAREDRETVLAAVDQTGAALEHAAPALQRDRDVVLKAVHRDGMALRYAPPELRADREVVARAVARSGAALAFAAEALRIEVELVRLAVASDAAALEVAPPEMRDNREVLLAAVCRDGAALRLASPRLRADRRIVGQAVARDGQALQYADPTLQGDFQIVLMATIRDGQAVQHAPARYRWNPVFLTRVAWHRRAARARGANI